MGQEIVNLFYSMEGFAAAASFLFIVLMIKQNIWCWPIGIISSIASIYVFYDAKLYMESVLYFYYVLIGFYGWHTWRNAKTKKLPLKEVNQRYYGFIAIIGSTLAILVGYIIEHFSDSPRPYCDSFSTIFSFIASYMEAHKIVSSWLIWIGVNLFSIWLYHDRGLLIYAGLMVMYFILSVAGYLQWSKDYQRQQSAELIAA